MGGDWERVTRLDARAAVARVAQATGVRLTIEGPCPGGEVGAAYVRWADGRRSVLGLGNPGAAPLAATARRAGVPAPDYQLVVPFGEVTILVQECLPGAPPIEVDDALVDAMLAVNERHAGLLAGRPDIPLVDLYLDRSGPGFCLHEPLAAHDRRTARLLDRVRDIGAGWQQPDGTDLLHMDFHPGNVLVDGGRITGLVDWDGACRGDRALDLVTLRFDLALHAPATGDRLAARLREQVPAGRRRAYWAHMALRLVDWAIRHHTAAEVELWLSVAERELGSG